MILGSSSCERQPLLGEDEELTLSKQPYTSDTLRIDGYYYLSNNEYGVTRIYFFFRDGTFLYLGSPSNLDDIPEYVSDQVNQGVVNRDRKYKWGVFNISAGRLEYERWSPNNGPLSTFRVESEILSDTSFRALRTYDNDGNLEFEHDWLYKFVEFSPKPDSTNEFTN